MNRWIDWLGMLWVIIGIGAGALAVLVALFGSFDGAVLGALLALACFTTGIVLMGFAVIVKYFETANRKRTGGNKRR